MRPSLDLIWIRQDLRLHDNPALHAASSRPCLITFCLEDMDAADGALGEAAKVWLHSALKSFANDLDNRCKARLLIYPGTLPQLLTALESQVDVQTIHWNRSYAPGAMQRDAVYQQSFEAKGIKVLTYKGNVLHEPWDLDVKGARPYEQFAPFQKASLQAVDANPQFLEVPAQLKTVALKGIGCSVDSLQLVKDKAWHKDILNFWDVSEKAGRDMVRAFVKDRMQHFPDSCEIPSVPATSKLSPYLSWGQISLRWLWAICENQKSAEGKIFQNQILWREFAQYTLFHDPKLTVQPHHKDFSRFPWKESDRNWQAWVNGTTGYPLVDAGMRELKQTGWIHNRVRMVVSSFLVKNLGIHWQKGAAYFNERLLDANLSVNTVNWQFVAGCGVECYPFSRIINPVTQGERFDSEGSYVYHWVPELRQLPEKWIHQPWKASESVLKKAGVQLGQNYPRPIVDFEVSRNEALEAFASISTEDEIHLVGKTG